MSQVIGSLNKTELSDTLIHDSSCSYNKGDIVVTSNQSGYGRLMVAIDDVPEDISIDNENYWKPMSGVNANSDKLCVSDITDKDLCLSGASVSTVGASKLIEVCNTASDRVNALKNKISGQSSEISWSTIPFILKDRKEQLFLEEGSTISTPFSLGLRQVGDGNYLAQHNEPQELMVVDYATDLVSKDKGESIAEGRVATFLAPKVFTEHWCRERQSLISTNMNKAMPIGEYYLHVGFLHETSGYLTLAEARPDLWIRFHCPVELQPNFALSLLICKASDDYLRFIFLGNNPVYRTISGKSVKLYTEVFNSSSSVYASDPIVTVYSSKTDLLADYPNATYLGTTRTIDGKVADDYSYDFELPYGPLNNVSNSSWGSGRWKSSYTRAWLNSTSKVDGGWLLEVDDECQLISDDNTNFYDVKYNFFINRTKLGCGYLSGFSDDFVNSLCYHRTRQYIWPDNNVTPVSEWFSQGWSATTAGSEDVLKGDVYSRMTAKSGRTSLDYEECWDRVSIADAVMTSSPAETTFASSSMNSYMPYEHSHEWSLVNKIRQTVPSSRLQNGCIQYNTYTYPEFMPVFGRRYSADQRTVNTKFVDERRVEAVCGSDRMSRVSWGWGSGPAQSLNTAPPFDGGTQRDGIEPIFTICESDLTYTPKWDFIKSLISNNKYTTYYSWDYEEDFKIAYSNSYPDNTSVAVNSYEDSFTIPKVNDLTHKLRHVDSTKPIVCLDSNGNEKTYLGDKFCVSALSMMKNDYFSNNHVLEKICTIPLNGRQSLLPIFDRTFPAGNYYFMASYGSGQGGTWLSQIEGKYYYFTTPVDVPAGGCLIPFIYAQHTATTGSRLIGYSNRYLPGSQKESDALFCINMSVHDDPPTDSSYTYLGESWGVSSVDGVTGHYIRINDTSRYNEILTHGSDQGWGYINQLWHCATGYFEWETSSLRQWLNSDATTLGGWWTPQSVYDTAPLYYNLLPGFLSLIPQDIKSKLKPVKHIEYVNMPTSHGRDCRINNGAVYNSSVTTILEEKYFYDKVFIPVSANICAQDVFLQNSISTSPLKDRTSYCVQPYDFYYHMCQDYWGVLYSDTTFNPHSSTYITPMFTRLFSKWLGVFGLGYRQQQCNGTGFTYRNYTFEILDNKSHKLNYKTTDYIHRNLCSGANCIQFSQWAATQTHGRLQHTQTYNICPVFCICSDVEYSPTTETETE